MPIIFSNIQLNSDLPNYFKANFSIKIIISDIGNQFRNSGKWLMEIGA